MNDQELQVARVCTGYRDLQFRHGERIHIVSGMETEVPPEHVEVVREYPNMVMLELTFVKSYYPSVDPSPRSYRLCVHKGAMLCSDVILQRISDKRMLVKDVVGCYEPADR